MLSLLLWNNTISSQEGLIVKSFKDISTVNQNARIFPKYDNNGDPASLVLVQVMTNDEIHFKGTYKLGDVEKKSNVYWVYMASGAKSLEVHCIGYEKLTVSFEKVSNGHVISLGNQCTYELVISVPAKKAVIQHDTVSVFIKGNVSQEIMQSQSIHNKHEYVDLGLSVKWATCNLGAKKPEDEGDYYAWGEVKRKSTFYDASTYKWCDGAYNNITKYSPDIDGKTNLELVDDAANKNWKGNWRIPTDAEWKELIEDCMWKFTKQNNKKGYLITSLINGNSIFLPTTGYMLGKIPIKANEQGNYWSSTLYCEAPANAYKLIFASSFYAPNLERRVYGLCVRAVCP